MTTTKQMAATTEQVEAGTQGEIMAHVLVLRSCNPDMSSYGGFRWPSSGPVECPDWDPVPKCGNGLHGWLWGEGEVDAHIGSINASDRKWLVVKVAEAEIVHLKGKVKFPRGEVVFCGSRSDATQYIYNNGGQGRAILFGSATAGDRGTATAGDLGTATAGHRGTAMAGYRGTATVGEGGIAMAGYRGIAMAGYRGTAMAGEDGTATAGDHGTATVGDYGTATAGEYGAATAGYRGTATAGKYGTATAEDYGTATAGEGGTATVGYYGTAMAGEGGTATAGEGGTAMAGYRGTLNLKWWDGSRYRIAVFYVGENGIEPNVPYKVDDRGRPYKVDLPKEVA